MKSQTLRICHLGTKLRPTNLKYYYVRYKEFENKGKTMININKINFNCI